MGNIKTGGGYTPAAHTIRPTLGGTEGPTLKAAPAKPATPTRSNPEAFKAAQAKVGKEVAGGHHGSGHSSSPASASHHGSGHGASAVYGDEHKAHDAPAVVSHKTHLAHGAMEGAVVAGKKAAHMLGHSKAGHVAHVVEHGAHKLAAKISPLGAAAAVANAVHNPSAKTGGEALSASLTATREIVQARATKAGTKAASTAATKAAENVIVKAAGRSGSKATAAIAKAEAPKVAAAVAKTVGNGKSAAAVAKAGEAATAALVKSGVKSTAAVAVKAAPTAAKAAGTAAAKAFAPAAAKAGGRFVPGLNVAIAATDAVVAGADMKKAYDKPTAKNISVAVASGITAAGSALAASNIPVVSQIGAGVSVVTGLGKAALESFWPD